MEKLFLLKSDFEDKKLNPKRKYFCPQCAIIEGVLAYFPKLKTKIDITYVDFERPRKIIVDLIGEENQSCPVLVLEDGSFINEPTLIMRHLAKKYDISFSH